ncbi:MULTISPECIES: hypothetical protein [unclassified Bradyrhizobium]|uniref:hypothetical protein n=1 Tax=unclassified Bradyrhizobium TaxID=2631580 RepID=UPI001BAE1EAC|nr:MULTISPECIES: hypothetical protein [unclassified Bradyrhizobium]MBR1224271.1 hypothetical protein [Bradyrhizobium sp. AUGA SZCCT0176]
MNRMAPARQFHLMLRMRHRKAAAATGKHELHGANGTSGERLDAQRSLGIGVHAMFVR